MVAVAVVTPVVRLAAQDLLDFAEERKVSCHMLVPSGCALFCSQRSVCDCSSEATPRLAKGRVFALVFSDFCLLFVFFVFGFSRWLWLCFSVLPSVFSCLALSACFSVAFLSLRVGPWRHCYATLYPKTLAILIVQFRAFHAFHIFRAFHELFHIFLAFHVSRVLHIVKENMPLATVGAALGNRNKNKDTKSILAPWQPWQNSGRSQ